MVWKQDLAQLKQQLKPDQEPVGPPPKPVPPPLPDQSLEDADLLFLRAMGGVAVPPPPVANQPLNAIGDQALPKASASLPNSNYASRSVNAEEAEADFGQALEDLKGLRPLLQNPVFLASSPSQVPPPAVMVPSSPEATVNLPSAMPALEKAPAASDFGAEAPMAASEAPHTRVAPVLMHLAAGMAIEVDGTLDLRKHSLNDAKERLSERVRDGLALKWRTILVTLGPNEALKQGFLAFLTTPQAQCISRYAQAPIPMGGAQAWVLYLAQSSQPEYKPLRQNNLDTDVGGML